VARAPRERGHPPVLKKYGQHFLTDERILGVIVDALAPTPADTVVEIGPGRGSLTDILVERSGRLIALEIDRALTEQLRKKYQDRTNVEIVQGDVLETDLHALGGSDFLLIGNVPYYITTPILFHALRPRRAQRAVFLVQREVADRMTSAAGTRTYGALSVNLQALARAELLFRVPAGAFHPPPKVESAVVRVTPRAQPLVPSGDENAFREMVQGIFGFRRKQMRRVIRELNGMTPSQADDLLSATAIAGEARPETLTPPQFVALFQRLREMPE
jgi:16S rRNA (adenine1518-N6/adenine1519-N6)-dimethyltransferase